MQALNIERRHGHWIFELSRPEKRNALSSALVEDLIAGVDEAHAAGVPLLVFRGAGRNFSAGFDFTGYQEESEGDLVLRFVRIEMLLQSVASSPSLTLGLAHGRNFGAGVDLFAVCKQRVCESEASFRMPGLNFGLVLGTRRFAQLVGKQNALEVQGETRSFSALEARDMGFVTAVHERAEWDGLIEKAIRTAGLLDPQTRAQFHGVLNAGRDSDDLAALVRSAARPGLKARIEQYLQC